MRPAQVAWPARLYFDGHFASSSASALPYPRCCFQYARNGRAAMVPDDRRRTEAELPALVLQPPADVDIVARRPELRVEPANGHKGVPPEGHVAARDVLCLPIGEQHVDWPAGRVGHAVRDQPISSAARCSVRRRPRSRPSAKVDARYVSQCGSG